MKDTDNNPWIKVTDRLPTEADAYQGEVLWYGFPNRSTKVGNGSWDKPTGSTHWKRLIPPPQPTPEEMEREAFEAWAKSKDFNCLGSKNPGNDFIEPNNQYYAHDRTEMAWKAWRARAKKGGPV